MKFKQGRTKVRGKRERNKWLDQFPRNYQRWQGREVRSCVLDWQEVSHRDPRLSLVRVTTSRLIKQPTLAANLSFNSLYKLLLNSHRSAVSFHPLSAACRKNVVVRDWCWTLTETKKYCCCFAALNWVIKNPCHRWMKLMSDGQWLPLPIVPLCPITDSQQKQYYLYPRSKLAAAGNGNVRLTRCNRNQWCSVWGTKFSADTITGGVAKRAKETRVSWRRWPDILAECFWMELKIFVSVGQWMHPEKPMRAKKTASSIVVRLFGYESIGSPNKGPENADSGWNSE